MKFRKHLLLFLAPILLSGFHCKKDKTPEEQLPPETQTGAGTFGCLVNGNIFKPKGSPFAGPILSCAYQFINGGYYFQLAARQDNGDQTLSIGLFTDSLPISQGQKIILYQYNVKGKAYGQYGQYQVGSSGSLYYTDSTGTGELYIKFYDSVNRIVSGTFWFNATTSTGQKVQIAGGRFDVKFTL